MAERRLSPSLVWLGGLIALSLMAAAIGGMTIYLQTRHADRVRAEAITHGSVEAGRAAIGRYGCGACHVIAGIDGANGQVGPDLSQVSRRATLAGRLSNDPEAMVRWLIHPQVISPGSGMPEQGVSERDARDMAAYLYAKN
ncbi:c-type cytochrome [Sphingomonas jatrophae]|uniref:Cytochrome c n=1 Tax=Sphingomonas jatrophae TaxID=1166337 RepID=A0A1I6J9Y7_9SPHN|nr:c-type cytochrome [Sphingomonas jatrophae]SFR75797.1 Cytochrome c [Sphingomonas jatrophae]